MPAIRTKTGQFLPGHSGNPRGRPAETQEAKDGKEMLRRAFPEAVETIVGILEEPGAKVSERLEAARYIIDRVLEKSVQPVAAEISPTDEKVLTLDEMYAIAEEIVDTVRGSNNGGE